MAYSTADVVLSCSPAVESGLHTDIQALLKEMNKQSASLKGRLRWSLERKVERDPSCSVSLIRVLLEELEKKLKRTNQIQKAKYNMQITPLLHTLYYVVIRSGSQIPTSLYQDVFECLMKMLTFPLPYSTVALNTLTSINMERNTPGSLYLRRVMAEQNLNNEYFTLQEKVFVLADPAVFSAPLETTLRAYLEVSNVFRDTPTVEKDLVLRVLQKGLGAACQSSKLVQALEALGDQVIEKYFQKVVLSIEQSIKRGAAGCANYMNRLQDIYRDILTTCKEETPAADHRSVHSRPMPFPQIHFLLWKDEDDLWNLLAHFTLHGSLSAEEEKNKRDSVRSEDSGIERDLKKSEVEDTKPPPCRNSAPAITRRNAFKQNSADRLSLITEKMETFPGRSPVFKEDRKRLTARVVVMGDDRVLGRLAKACHSIRERESKRLILSKKLTLQWYYIPVTDVEPSHSSPDSSNPNEGRLSLAFLLGRMDPWYNQNINSLGATISKLPSMHCDPRERSEQSLFLLDNLCYYLRCGMQPVNLPLYSVKMTRSSCNESDVVEEVFVSHLEAEVPEFRHLKQRQEASEQRARRTTVEVFGAVITVSYTKTSLSKREVVKGEAPITCGVVITSEPAAVTTGEDFLTVRFHSLNPGNNTKIQTQKISIRTLEQRTLCVCLDKDPRRTYTNVQRIEVSPCLDPGCNIRSRFSFRNERELPLSKYVDKVLSLPINTFSGVSPRGT